MKTVVPKTHPGLFLFGYRSDEVNLKVPEVPDNTSYCLHKSYFNYDPNVRPPMAATFTTTIPAVPPRPDVTNPTSLLDGIAKRMAYQPKKYNRNERRRFRKFVRNWVRSNLEPIDIDDDLDFNEWLDSTNYPDWRKREIIEAKNKLPYYNGEIDEKQFINHQIKIFAKEEYYPEYKHFRGIWARSDTAKALLGPFFRKIEKKLFKLPYFIKKVPKLERPKYINDFMNDCCLKFQGTDYTSFESHFTTDMMDDCEFELYRYMSSKNAKAALLCRLLFKILASENFAINKYFTVKVNAKRMSGEMNTSLGNGFSNLMFLLYACHKYKLSYSGPIIEGDDALIGLNDRIPQEYYDSMGLNVKLEFVSDISKGSFCGLVYDPVELINIREPIETLCTTPWVTRKYVMCNIKTYYSLLRSKALSLMFEYPGCPIVYKYGRKIFDLLHEYEIKLKYEDSYKFDRDLKAFKAYTENKLPHVETGPRTRLLMEEVFKISVSDQLRIEKEIDDMTISDMNIPSVLSLVPDCWIQNFSRYVLLNKYSTFNNLKTIVHNRFERLNNHHIIEMSSGQLKSNVLLTYDEFKSGKTCECLKEYELYKDRYIDARRRHRINNKKISFSV